jgi:hypothetical protein
MQTTANIIALIFRILFIPCIMPGLIVMWALNENRRSSNWIFKRTLKEYFSLDYYGKEV